MKKNIMTVLAISTTLSLAFSGSTSLASEVTANQNDAIADLGLEIASGICSAEVLEQFEVSGDGSFTMTIKSKTFPNGIRLATLKFENSEKQLIVLKPYGQQNVSNLLLPMCKLSSKGLSQTN